jgi:DNA-binding CsgD family transcriptional regulator
MTTSPALLDYDRLLGAVYEGPLETTPWQTFLPLCREMLNAKVISLVLRPPAEGDRGVILNQLRTDVGARLTVQLADPNDWQTSVYREQFFALDPFINLPPGTVVTLQELLPAAALQDSEYYRRYLQPAGVLHILGADIGAPGSFQARLRFSRGPDEAPFCAGDKALCALIVPHLERAIAIHASLNRVESERDLFAGAVEQLAVGTILLDENGHFLKANQPATRILAEKDGLQVRNGQLQLATRQRTQDLQALIQRVLASAHRNETAVVEALRVARPSGHADLGLMVRLVPQIEWAEAQNRPAVAVFISDPEQTSAASQQTLMQLFGLTRAEAVLATLLTRGLSLQEAAAELQVSPHTARAQLRSIFAKTGVTRQAELIRLLVKSVAALA